MIAVVHRDDDASASEVQSVDADESRKKRVAALADVFRAVFVRVAPIIVEVDVAGKLAIVAKQRPAALAQALMDFRIARAAQPIDELAENLLALRYTLLRHHRIGVLSRGARRKKTSSDESNGRKMNEP